MHDSDRENKGFDVGFKRMLDTVLILENVVTGSLT